MGADLILALDFGGTKHAAGLARVGSAEWLAVRRAPAPPGSDGLSDRRLMLTLADELLAEAPGEVAAVGVSFGGPVDWPSQRVILSHHVPGWEDTPLVAQLQSRFSRPAVMDNDANAAALGEWRFGAGRGCHSLLYITVSTGIGGGWVLGDTVWRGASSMAGEIGHLAVDPQGPECVCGKRGCVEVIGCGPAIAGAMRDRQPGQVWNAALVNDLAEAGNPDARAVIEHAAWALGTGIGHAINLVNPERVVIGGGVAGAGRTYWQALRQAARRQVLPQMRVEIVRAGLGGDSPLWGALALAEAALRRD